MRQTFIGENLILFDCLETTLARTQTAGVVLNWFLFRLGKLEINWRITWELLNIFTKIL